MPPDVRERLYRALERLRQDPDVPHSMADFAELVVQRLDAAFPSEVPTKPGKKAFAAVREELAKGRGPGLVKTTLKGDD